MGDDLAWPGSWLLAAVNLPSSLQELSGAPLKEGQPSLLVIFPLAGSRTERHKHSLKMKATKINSKQPSMQTRMQTMQAGLLFIRQKAVIRSSLVSLEVPLLFLRIPNKP